MKLSKIGRIALALVASLSLGLGMTACGGGTIGYMWVVGTFYNQITGFKIDNYTGNLTAIPHSPFASGGSNPTTILVKPGGGRFVYVINTGSDATAPVAPSAANPNGTLATQKTAGNIAEYSVGGDGTLTFQQIFNSQGIRPTWATFDSTGNYLYVQDQYAPDTSGNGSITAFTVASDTGRLALITNAVVKNPTTGVNTTYFTVGASPVMSKIGAGNCLFTLLPNSVFAYVIGSGGQLTLAQTGAQQIGSGVGSLSSINTGAGTAGSAYTYITEKSTNMIYSESAGSSTCSLATINQSQQTNLPSTGNPVNSLTSQSGKFLYVLNQTTTNSTGPASASISAFSIDPTTGRLSNLSGTGTTNPYSTGSIPLCLAQDPSNQYLYTSNSGDNTVTGKLIDQNRGTLGDLTRGSVFPTTQTPTCLAVSGNL